MISFDTCMCAGWGSDGTSKHSRPSGHWVYNDIASVLACENHIEVYLSAHWKCDTLSTHASDGVQLRINYTGGRACVLPIWDAL